MKPVTWEKADLLHWKPIERTLIMKESEKKAADPDGSPEQMETEIRHITLLDKGRYMGHYLVGLLINTGSAGKLKKV